jgi:hypothetical protein
VQLVKRMSHGLTAQVSYTWSHAIDDDNQQGASNNISSTYNNATFNGNYALDKGSSTLDQRHRFPSSTGCGGPPSPPAPPPSPSTW